MLEGRELANHIGVLLTALFFLFLLLEIILGGVDDE